MPLLPFSGAGLGFLKTLFVKKAGDTMTGTLNIDPPNSGVKALVLKGTVANTFPLTGIIDYYKFDENTGTSVGDSVGANTGTWQGTLGSQWTTGIINSGGNFVNASTNTVQIKTSKIMASLVNSSISVWIKTSATPPAGGYAVYAERAAAGNDIWKLDITSGGNLRFVHRDDANTLDLISGSVTVNNGAWHHVVVTKSGTTINSYIDGVIDISAQTLSGTDTMTDAIVCLIGGDKQASSADITSVIDELGLWNVTLTSANVTSLYNAGAALAYNGTVNVNLLDVQNSSGTSFATINPAGNTLTLAGNADAQELVIKQNSTQTSDMVQIQTSGGSPITRINPQGYFSTNLTNKTNIFSIKSGGVVVATGTTTVNNSNSAVVGVGTKFTTEMGIGDQISVSSNPGSYATIATITDDTHLTLAANSPSIGNGTTQTINIKKALFGLVNSAGTMEFLVQDGGNVGLAGQLYLDVALSLNGQLRMNGNSLWWDTDNTYGTGKFSSGISGVSHSSFGGYRFQTSDGGTKTQLWIDKNFVGIGTGSPSALLSVAEKLLVTSAGLMTKYNNIATAGNGLPSIYGQGRSTAQTGAVASVVAYTVGSADGSFEVSANVNVTTSTTHNFTVTCTYTDETNTSRTLTLGFTQLAGATLLTAITNITGAGPYESPIYHIRAKASTSITIATTGTFTTVTYNVEGIIKQTA